MLNQVASVFSRDLVEASDCDLHLKIASNLKAVTVFLGRKLAQKPFACVDLQSPVIDFALDLAIWRVSNVEDFVGPMIVLFVSRLRVAATEGLIRLNPSS